MFLTWFPTRPSEATGQLRSRQRPRLRGYPLPRTRGGRTPRLAHRNDDTLARLRAVLGENVADPQFAVAIHDVLKRSSVKLRCGDQGCEQFVAACAYAPCFLGHGIEPP
jgi:hypothetical protein